MQYRNGNTTTISMIEYHWRKRYGLFVKSDSEREQLEIRKEVLKKAPIPNVKLYCRAMRCVRTGRHLCCRTCKRSISCTASCENHPAFCGISTPCKINRC